MEVEPMEAARLLKSASDAKNVWKLLVKAGEDNCAFARRALCPGEPGSAMTRRQYFDAKDVRFNGQWRQDDIGARALCGVRPEDFESDEEDWQPGFDDTDVDVDACVRSEEA